MPTPPVFKALGLAPGERCAAAKPPAPVPQEREALLAWLAGERNDLEPPAIGIAPAIEDVIRAIAALPGCRLARMSGSGSACFGLFDTEEAAAAAVQRPRGGASRLVGTGGHHRRVIGARKAPALHSTRACASTLRIRLGNAAPRISAAPIQRMPSGAAAVRRHLRPEHHELQREVREHMGHHARQAPPARCARAPGPRQGPAPRRAQPPRRNR